MICYPYIHIASNIPPEASQNLTKFALPLGDFSKILKNLKSNIFENIFHKYTKFSKPSLYIKYILRCENLVISMSFRFFSLKSSSIFRKILQRNQKLIWKYKNYLKS